MACVVDGCRACSGSGARYLPAGSQCSRTRRSGRTRRPGASAARSRLLSGGANASRKRTPRAHGTSPSVGLAGDSPRAANVTATGASRHAAGGALGGLHHSVFDAPAAGAQWGRCPAAFAGGASGHGCVRYEPERGPSKLAKRGHDEVFVGVVELSERRHRPIERRHAVLPHGGHCTLERWHLELPERNHREVVVGQVVSTEWLVGGWGAGPGVVGLWGAS